MEMAGASADEPYEVRYGENTLRFEPPDLYIATRVGMLSLAAMAEGSAEIMRFAQGKKWILSIVDATRVGSASAEVRTAIQTRVLPLLRGTAIIVATAQQRMIFARFVGPGLPAAFVATEAEARTWINARRRELEAEAAANLKGTGP